MRFDCLPLDQARGHILGHNIAGSDGRRALRKGRVLGDGELEKLAALGRERVWVACLEPGDVEENGAADRLAQALQVPGLRLSVARTGRVNLHATGLGILRVSRDALRRFNDIRGVTLSTLSNHAPISPGQMVATLKILPYALPGATVEALEVLCRESSVLTVTPLKERRVGLILNGSPSARERIERGFTTSLTPRLEALGSTLEPPRFVPLLGQDPGDGQALARAIDEALGAGLDLLLLAGETAIMDERDVIPRAIEEAKGRIEGFGAPVDPGNLLLLAYRDAVPIVAAPGCARSAKRNIIDLVLPRLLAGDRLRRSHIVDLGLGGLLDDVPERPMPRSRFS